MCQKSILYCARFTYPLMDSSSTSKENVSRSDLTRHQRHWFLQETVAAAQQFTPNAKNLQCTDRRKMPAAKPGVNNEQEILLWNIPFLRSAPIYAVFRLWLVWKSDAKYIVFFSLATCTVKICPFFLTDNKLFNLSGTIWYEFYCPKKSCESYNELILGTFCVSSVTVFAFFLLFGLVFAESVSNKSPILLNRWTKLYNKG